MRMLKRAAVAVARNRQDIAVVAVGLAVFLSFMAVFAWVMFPEGQRLGHLGANARTDGLATDRSGARVSYASRDGDGGDGGGHVARLTRAVRDVDHRSGSDVVWSRASDEMPLAHRDAVQTQSKSKAFISFVEGGNLRLDENSLVVIRESTPDPFAARSRPAVVMMRGRLSGGLAAGDAIGLDVQTPAGLVSLSRAGGADAGLDFSLGVGDDDATRLSLSDGEAEILVNGQRTTVGADEALTIDAGGNVVRHKVPSMPNAVLPADGAQVRFGGAPPHVAFRWQGEGAQTYRLLVALDPAFDNVIVDARSGQPAFDLAALRPGTYWWRVSGVVDGHEGPPSTARALSLVRDERPPTLSIEPLPNRVANSAVTVRGQAAPGADVFVRGEPIAAAANGRFEHVVRLTPGTNIVVVEAVDGLGNVAFASATVTSKSTTTSE